MMRKVGSISQPPSAHNALSDSVAARNIGLGYSIND